MVKLTVEPPLGLFIVHSQVHPDRYTAREHRGIIKDTNAVGKKPKVYNVVMRLPINF